jgi:Hypothetical protein (DUF2513)
MKRDLDLIRDILLAVENWNHPEPIFLEGMACEGKDKQEIGYQIDLLNDVKYETAAILRMTMAGHEYLDSVRSPEVWKKTKSTLEKVGGGAALDVIKEIASKVLAEIVKAHTGL